MMRIDQQIPTQPGRGAHGADAPDEVLSVPAQRPGEADSKFGYQKDYGFHSILFHIFLGVQ